MLEINSTPRIVTFDIETANWFGTPGVNSYDDLKIALVGIHDSLTDTYDSFVVEELPRLWQLLESTDILVGYNSDHFDIPLLNRYYPGDLSKIKSVDLLKEIYDSLGRRIKLDAVAEGTLNKKKSGHGGQSIIWWREGEVEKVRSYCLKDVELTRKLFDHALENKALKYKELGRIQEVKLKTDHWLKEEKPAALTFTLGF